MLNLVTGTPGSGKTQYVIDYVLGNEQYKGREVWYWGIPELSESLGWHRIGVDTFDLEAAHKWHELVPDGAIVIIDEAHKVWPKKGSGKEPPWYEPLGTTRHRGLTLFALTQYPAHVDTSYRGRVERHWHLERKLGWQRSFLLEFEKASNPQDRSDRDLATRKAYYKFKPEIWKLYKSATVHNVERRPLPKKLLLVPVSIAAVAVLFWWVYSHLTERGEPQAPAEVPALLPSEAVAEGSSEAVVRGDRAPMTQGEYLALWVPLIEGQPWTAPVYDEVRKVQSYPRPQCVEGVDAQGNYRCICYTQQATRMNVSEDFCRGVVQLGYFDPAMPDQYLTSLEREYIPPAPEPSRGPTWNLRPYQYTGERDGPQIDTRAAMERVRSLREQ